MEITLSHSVMVPVKAKSLWGIMAPSLLPFQLESGEGVCYLQLLMGDETIHVPPGHGYSDKGAGHLEMAKAMFVDMEKITC